MPDELEQNVEQQNNDALIQQLEELTSVMETQAELEQAEKEEQALLEQEQQTQLEEEQQLMMEQQEQEQLAQEQLEQETREFREAVLKSLNDMNETYKTNSTALSEQQTEIIEQQALMLDYFEGASPAVKQFSEWGIIFLGLIPLFFVVRWLGQMFDSAFR